MPVDLERPVEVAAPGLAISYLLLECVASARDTEVVGEQGHVVLHDFCPFCIAKEVVPAELAQDADPGILALSAFAGDREADPDAVGEFGIADPDLHRRSEQLKLMGAIAIEAGIGA